MRFGWPEIVLVLVVVLLLFGAKRIPEMMRGIGRGAREFKEGLKEGNEKDTSEK